eukprot:1139114-Karenia_brevis.AAC.1
MLIKDLWMFKPHFAFSSDLETAASVAGNGIEDFVSQQGTQGGSSSALAPSISPPPRCKVMHHCQLR